MSQTDTSPVTVPAQQPVIVQVAVAGRRWAGTAPAQLLGWGKDGRARVRFPNGRTLHVPATRITTIEAAPA